MLQHSAHFIIMNQTGRDPKLWEQGCKDDPVRNQVVLPDLIECLDRLRPTLIGDVGSGTGYLSRAAALHYAYPAHWFLLERDPRMLQFSSEICATKDGLEVVDYDLVNPAQEWDRPLDLAFSCFSSLDFGMTTAIAGNLERLLRRDRATISFSKVLDCMSAGQYSYRAVEDILADKTAAAVHSFVIVHDTRRVLSFRCGRFFPRTDPLYGRRTIGLGGAVSAKQVDLLFESMFGIVASAIDELCSGIGLPRRLAERARYGGEIKPWFGVHSSRTDHSPTTLHMVLSYRCPAEFTPTKAALSVNDLRWIDPSTMPNCLEDYDTTSQFLLSQEYVRDLVRQAT
ncbi:hypothetical protein WHZ78_33410 [Bradyrhizobium symbiodeficiens]|uniref:hypothetical protein n=1 Tax=Bradyrhizobium symbiodeficiens TaxID=1404367 RepID=UPI0030CB321D